MIKYGEQIRKYRELADLSQEQLAEKCGWLNDVGKGQQSLIGNYEREDRQPTLDRLDKISQVLGVGLADLLDDGKKKVVRSDDELSLGFSALKPKDKKFILDLARRLAQN